MRIVRHPDHHEAGARRDRGSAGPDDTAELLRQTESARGKAPREPLMYYI